MLKIPIPLISDFLGGFYLADVLDIIIITFLVYWLIILLKNSRYFFVFSGLLTLAAVYFLAVFFDLRLTFSVLQSFFGILILGMVIIFQEELRRFFELIAFWGGGWKSKKMLNTSSTLVDDIVNVCERLAKQKIGLIIVIRGRETLVRHLQGGYHLNGEVSEAILQSIFDPSSPGHDGAVIIEGDKIVRFGVHLPPSQDLGQIGKFGTRHSAALGISDISDALAIVVSEERGVISVARSGHLKPVEDINDLKNRISVFLRDKFVNREPKKIFSSDVRSKVWAMIIAMAMWFLLVYK